MGAQVPSARLRDVDATIRILGITLISLIGADEAIVILESVGPIVTTELRR